MLQISLSFAEMTPKMKVEKSRSKNFVLVHDLEFLSNQEDEHGRSRIDSPQGSCRQGKCFFETHDTLTHLPPHKGNYSNSSHARSSESNVHLDDRNVHALVFFSSLTDLLQCS